MPDVPSPIDLRLPEHAQAWASTAMLKRPWRTAFFAAFGTAIKEATIPVKRLLELGSGPGFLAEHLLTNLPPISYVALDFSMAMHQLAAERLGSLAQHVLFVERSFRESLWGHGLGTFDVIVTHQAVHELRHKRHAPTLHAQAKLLLVPGGIYLVCDHYAGEDGMRDTELYMTVGEQYQALKSAGFDSIDQLLLKGGLVLHRAS